MARKPIDAYRDPYRRCERQCNHDLARAVTLAELLGSDGPHPDVSPLLAPTTTPAASRGAEELIAIAS